MTPSTFLSRARQLVLGLSLLSAFAAAPLRSQQIEGELVEETTGAPIAGAFVVLLDSDGRQVDVALTDAQGRFELVATGAGSYSLGLDRIGYLSTTTEPIRLAVGQRVLYRLTSVVEPVALDDITVAVERECEVNPAEGEATHRVWQEARKALNLTAYTQRMGLLDYTVVSRERELDPYSLSVRDEASRRRTGVSRGSPYVSLSVDLLARHGFVQVSGDTLVFFGPDAGTLLSDWFADTHCFHLRESAEEPGSIGLAFAPTRERMLPDIRGTLWIDAATAELERLDYEYTSLPKVVGQKAATGRIEFERLPDGEWIIPRWWIRMPVVRLAAENTYSHITMDPSQRVTTVLAIEEDSGEVTDVVSRRSGAPAPAGAEIAAGEPAEVAVGEAEREPAEIAAGEVAAGEAERAPADGAVASAEREPSQADGEAEPAAATPPATCADGVGLSGWTRDERTGTSLPGTRVEATWSAPAERSAAARADAAGRYLLCGLPPAARVIVQASFPARTARSAVTLPSTGVRTLDLELGGRAAVEKAELASSIRIRPEPADGSDRIRGVVRDDVTGLPLPGTQVSAPGVGAGTVAAPGGEFRIPTLPDGRHRLVVGHLGYVPAETVVDLAAGMRLDLDVRLIAAPIAVAALEVEIPSEADAEGRISGEARYLIRSSDIPKTGGLTVGDLIERRMPGVRYRRGFCPGIITRNGPVSLVVIDEQTFRDTCVLNLVEPEDIETLALIPGQMAMARYGSSAGAGVIVITTKHGRND